MAGLYERGSAMGESVNLKISAKGFFYESRKNVPEVVDEATKKIFMDEGYREYETMQV